MSRIGLVIYDLRSGGAERVLCKWSDLLSQNHEVFMYTFDSASEPEYSFSGVLRELDVPSENGGKIRKIKTVFNRINKLRKQAHKDKIDILISFCSTANFPSMFIKLPRAASIRVYTEYQTYKPIYQFLLKHTSSKLIVQTQRLKQDILKDIGTRYGDKILVIGNPLDKKLISEKSVEKLDKQFEKELEGKKVISLVASFKTTKNHCNLLKSFKLLCKKHQDIALLLIGADGELEDEIKKMAQDPYIKNSVYFVGKTNNPFKYVNKSDLFVLPSITEGIPNVLIEALSVRIPVIATDCASGPREILCEFPNLEKHTRGVEFVDYGVLVEEFNPVPNFNINEISKQNEYLATAIEIVLYNDVIMKKYRDAASKRSKIYDLDVYKQKLDILVEKI